jgi:hypothetical protein
VLAVGEHRQFVQVFSAPAGLLGEVDKAVLNRRQGLSHQDRAVHCDQHAGAQDIAQLQQCRDADRGWRCLRVALQLGNLQLSVQAVDTYFGTSFYTLDIAAAQPLIERKNVIPKND